VDIAVTFKTGLHNSAGIRSLHFYVGKPGFATASQVSAFAAGVLPTVELVVHSALLPRAKAWLPNGQWTLPLPTCEASPHRLVLKPRGSSSSACIVDRIMNVSDGIRECLSTRAFLNLPIPGPLVRSLLEAEASAPSGGNLQPWRVYALAGQPLQALKKQLIAHPDPDPDPDGEPREYAVYPRELWELLRTRSYECGEDLYAKLGIWRETAMAHSKSWREPVLFGAPVGLLS
jgi:hypothetical protein